MLRPIKNKEQYEEALERVYHLMQKDIQVGSKLSDELEVLSILIKEYENEFISLPKPNPIEAIKFRMEQMNMTKSDMAKYIGSQSRVSEILSRKRQLTLKMVKSLYKGLKIPAEILLA